MYRAIFINTGFVCMALCLVACGSDHKTIGNSPPDTTPPSIPQNVAVTAPSATEVDVSWSPSSDNVAVAGYRIYRDGAASPLASTPAASYNDTSVVTATAYSYVVTAYDAAGNESARSTAAAITTPGQTPTGGGLDARPANSSCVAWARPTVANGITVVRAFPNLGFNSPVAMLQAPGDTANWYVVEKAGKIRKFANTPNVATATDFLDITAQVNAASEGGLLGLAFAPSYPTDNRIFVSYTTGATSMTSRISAFHVVNGVPDTSNEDVLISLAQPEQNHKGGNVMFGPDGDLYIGFGDGGGGGDMHEPNGNSQTLTTMLGKMLRIDVSGASGYTIPADNPFATNNKCSPQTVRSNAACAEIYAWGFRNPWRWSFDRPTGQLWVADVGQDLWEEVDIVQKGGNYGWRCREGAHNYNTANCTGGYIDPVAEYNHSTGSFSITGGYVYRGTQQTSLLGHYVFGDLSGHLWAYIPENNAANNPRGATDLGATNLQIVSFGQGSDGELYAVDYTGTLQHLVFNAPASGSVPDRLSQTGCVNASTPTQPASGLIPYSVNAPFWSDGASKDRWLALPDGQTITRNTTTNDWDFPAGSVLMKNFSVAGKLIETRLLMRHPDGIWGGFTYQWNDAQTEATRVQGGLTRALGGGQSWIYPSESQCMECHTSAAGFSLGLETAQLNRSMLYPQTGRTANELTTLDAIHVLTPAIAADPAGLPKMPDPADTTADLTQRARAYLHTNCSQCHRPSGPTPSNMDLRYTTALAQTNACNATPQSGDLGLGAAARLIAPGNAQLSIVANRMNRRDANGMPRLGSAQVDTAGVQLITQWINQLTSCQ